jgi:hypothetical protein
MSNMVRPPGNLASGPNPVTTNGHGGVSVPIRSRGAGTYILVASTSPNGPGVRVQSTVVGCISGGRLVKKLPLSTVGSSGRYVPILNYIVYTSRIHLDYTFSLQGLGNNEWSR